jgi:ComF family protein
MQRSGSELLEEADILVPVPLHRWRLLKRRYNQAALIAKALASPAGKYWSANLLKRARATASQGHMKPNERAKNVKGAFYIDPEQAGEIVGKNILLIDDVYTTGATVRECTRTLIKAGAAEVNVLCLARVVRQG